MTSEVEQAEAGILEHDGECEGGDDCKCAARAEVAEATAAGTLTADESDSDEPEA